MSYRLMRSILTGVLTIFILVIAASFVSSLILRFTGVTEDSFLWILTGFSFAALFAGGFISGGKAGERGWFAGILTAALYSVIVFLTQFLSFNTVFDLQQLAMHGGYALAAVLGGMTGVNLSGEKGRES